MGAAALGASRSAQAACHVVRAGATGNGADWTSAYPDLPNTLVRGDVYYVAGGTYAPHDFNDADVGTQTIEIRAATAAAHCTDTGWNASYVAQSVFVAKGGGSIFDFNTDYYVISGQYRGADWKSGYGIKLDDTGKGACEAGISGGLSGTGVHDITVSYVEIDGSHANADSCNEQGVEFINGSHDLQFRFLWNHDVGNTNFFLRGGGGAKNFTIEQSWIADDYSSPAVHGEACSCSEGLQNLVMRDNYFADIIGTAHIATPSGAGFHTGNDNNGPWYIHGNVFLATPGHNHCAVGDGILAAFDVSFSGDIYFANNTIANINQANCAGLDSTGIQFGAGFKAGLQNVHIQNNLWWQSDQISMVAPGDCAGPDVTCTSLAWDHNAYFQLTDGSAQNDPDPSAQVVAIDPFMASATNDFRLAQATNAGVPLDVSGQTIGTDMLGVTRGADGVWDRGAFEFCDSGACIASGTDGGIMDDSGADAGGKVTTSTGGCGCRLVTRHDDDEWIFGSVAMLMLGARRAGRDSRSQRSATRTRCSRAPRRAGC